MKAFRFGAVLCTAVLLVAAPSQGAVIKESYASATLSFAGGTPTTSGVYDSEDLYSIGPNNYKANLNPLKATEVPGTAGNFFDVLSAAFPVSAGWSYASAANLLSDDSIEIKTYDVQGTASRVGAEFHVKYVPHGADPTTNIHWIQVVTDNHAVSGAHGTNENLVDNPFSPSGRSPYYDDGGAATDREFYDFPGRVDPTNAHTWSAVLFLVQGPAAGTPGLITLLRPGISWGWTTWPFPLPNR